MPPDRLSNKETALSLLLSLILFSNFEIISIQRKVEDKHKTFLQKKKNFYKTTKSLFLT